MNEKYLYFRTVSTLTDDDDDDSSCLFPVSSYRGSWTFDATTIIMYFKSMHEKTMIGGSSYDNVVVNITINQHKNFLNTNQKSGFTLSHKNASIPLNTFYTAGIFINLP